MKGAQSMPPGKKPRGFQCLTPAQRSAVASKGGKAAHVKGTAHQWTSDEAIEAGRKGGFISRGGRGRAPAESS